MKIDSKLLTSGIICSLTLVTMAGCAGTANVTQPAAQNMPVGNEPAKPVLEGKVVETMNAGGYTYICLEKDGKKGWAAVPTMDVKVGNEITLQPGAEMGQFVSKTLNRTFDKITFSAGPADKSAAQPAALPTSHPVVPAALPQNGTASPAIKEALAEKPFYAGKVVETMGAGGYTYICLEKDAKKAWLAVPSAVVKVGDEIEVKPGMEMGKFTSKSLNRTFDNIIFSPGLAPKK